MTVGSDRANQRAAVSQPLFDTAKLNEINPAAGTLEKLPDFPNSRIGKLLLFAWHQLSSWWC